MLKAHVLRGASSLVLAALLIASASPAVAFGLTTFSGTVDEWGTNAPLAGVKVEVFNHEDPEAESPPILGSTLTAADGTYSIAGIADGVRVGVAFEDTTDTYRDMTAPSRGLPTWYCFSRVTDGTPVTTDCTLISFENLFLYRTYRVAGENRYDTAVLISRNNFSAADTVVLASGASFPDALAASPLAGAFDAPLLLTKPTALPTSVGSEIKRLGATKVYVIGSTSAVSDAVVAQVRALGITDIVRLGGSNRYATAEKVVYALPTSYFTDGALPFVCRGDGFADALAASPFAYYDGFPILLTKPNSLPAETARAWKYMVDRGSDAVLAIGSTGAVSDAVLETMAGYVPGGELYGNRIAGSNRYSTAYAVADYWGVPFDYLGMANGGNFPDALAGGAGIGRRGGALILTPGSYLHPSAEDTLWNHGWFAIDLQCYGGVGALTDDTCIDAIVAMGVDFYDIDNPDGYVTIASATSPLSVFKKSVATAASGVHPASASTGDALRPKMEKADFEARFKTLASKR